LGTGAWVSAEVGGRFRAPSPQLKSSPFPGGINFPIRDGNGNALFTQINVATLVTPPGGGTAVCTPGSNAGDVSVVTNPINPNPPACLTTANNIAQTQNISPFKEVFLGNSARPRVAVGIGANWNSPFGPLRIDFAKTLLKQDGDDTKSFTFNVGTQF